MPELYPAGRDAEGGRAARSHQALRHHPGRADLPDRAGHGVAVLLKIYAHCIDGQADAASRRITDAFGTQDAQPDPEPGDEGDDNSEQAS